MSLNDNAIMTLADLKNRLQISETTDTNDIYYNNLINAVSDFLPEYLSREIIAPAAADEIFDGTGDSFYYINNQRFQNIYPK